jgi:electron transport complex protein RnfB
MPPLELLLSATATLTTLGVLAALALHFSAAKSPGSANNLIDIIDNLLPQTQCGQCGHAGCRPYAEAIANGEAHNRCPPGGDATIAALAEVLNKSALLLDGELKPKAVAFIREAECIGCTKCIQACPVDAILGATKLMHTVIADECTGCDLCVEPCPVDCIEMRPLPNTEQIITRPLAAHYKTRFIAHNIRLQREEAEREARRLARKNSAKTKAIEPTSATTATTAAVTAAPLTTLPITSTTTNKQEQIQAAIARAKAKKSAPKTSGPQQ